MVCNDDGAQNCHRRHSRATLLAAPTQLYYIPAKSSPPPTLATGPSGKNPPNIRFEKFVKLIDHIYACNAMVWQILNMKKIQWPETEIMLICQSLLGNACNSLTNFEYEANEMNGNGNDVNLLKACFQNNSWNHIKWIIFCRILAIWDQSGSPCPECPARITIAMKGEIRFQEINGSSPCSRKLISSLI